MGEQKEKHFPTKIVLLMIVAAAVIAVGAVILFMNRKEVPSSEAGRVVDWDVEAEPEDTAGEVPGIRIPGYETMSFQAGETVQSVNIGNPLGNPCYFVISIQIVDGAELFHSDYLKPGEGFESIEINEPLATGEYTAMVQYKCYALDDKSPLNGANAEFRLIVKE